MSHVAPLREELPCSLVSAFSKVPLYLRQNVSAVTAVHSAVSSSAYTNGSQITLLSTYPVDLDVLVQQSAYAQVWPSHKAVLKLMSTYALYQAVSNRLGPGCICCHMTCMPLHLQWRPSVYEAFVKLCVSQMRHVQ